MKYKYEIIEICQIVSLPMNLQVISVTIETGHDQYLEKIQYMLVMICLQRNKIKNYKYVSVFVFLLPSGGIKNDDYINCCSRTEELFKVS